MVSVHLEWDIFTYMYNVHEGRLSMIGDMPQRLLFLL